MKMNGKMNGDGWAARSEEDEVVVVEMKWKVQWFVKSNPESTFACILDTNRSKHPDDVNGPGHGIGRLVSGSSSDTIELYPAHHARYAYDL